MSSRARSPRFLSIAAHSTTMLALIFVLLLSFSSPTVASCLQSHKRSGSVHPALNFANGPALGLGSSFIADPRRHDGLKRRERDDDEEERRATTATRTAIEPPTSTSLETSIAIATSAVTEVPIPSPFDSSLNPKNFTAEGCPAFFDTLLNDDTFKDCVSISSLLQTSTGFFDITRSFARITRLLDLACSTPSSECASTMRDLADKIVRDDACGADYRRKNPLVLKALNGFLGYPHVRDATCLKNPATDNYCYADAITNSSSPADSYPYYLGVGVPYPPGVRPTCNVCLLAVMSIYAKASKDNEQPVSDLYNEAAERINVGCGPSFVEMVAVPSVASQNLDVGMPFGLPPQYTLPFTIGILLLYNMI